jgi:dCTP deaminase
MEGIHALSDGAAIQGKATMILNDHQIRVLAGQGMIDPFEPRLVRGAREWSACAFVRPVQLRIRSAAVREGVSDLPARARDGGGPEVFNAKNLEKTPLHEDESGKYFILPARTYGLGVAVEELHLPGDVTAICVGKSTYARCGIIAKCHAGRGWVARTSHAGVLEFKRS